MSARAPLRANLTSAAAAARGSSAKAPIDFSKYTVYYTGVYEDTDEKLIFTGNLAEHPGVSRVSTVSAAGIVSVSSKTATIDFEEFRSGVKKILDEGHCAGNVDPGYVLGDSKREGIFNINPIRMLLVGPNPSRPATRSGRVVNEPVAFLIGREAAPEGRGAARRHGAYIDVICSMPGVGVELLKYFHKLVVTAELGTFIKLSSLANVVTLYPKYGYLFRHNCDDGIAPIGLPKTLMSKSDANPTGRNFKASPAPKDTEKAYTDPTYLDFMYNVLHKNGLTVKTKDCGPGITKAQFVEYNCAEDGFSMAKCDLSDSATLGGRRRKTQRRKTQRRKTHKRR